YVSYTSTSTSEILNLSLHDALPIYTIAKIEKGERKKPNVLSLKKLSSVLNLSLEDLMELCDYSKEEIEATVNNSYCSIVIKPEKDRKSTRLNSSHVSISYAVFCLKK